MGNGTSTVVPANRLGQLLAEARLEQGADLETFASRSEFTVGELSDFEAGHRILSDDAVAKVTNLYAIDCGPIIPQRTQLTIDLNDNVLSAAGHALPLSSADHDHVLERYLSLVYVLRNGQPGTTVPLRDQDVAILAASLAEREELIAEQLLAAMDRDRQSVSGLVGWLRKRLWVPGVGALVGAVSVGTLIMVSTSGSSAVETATSEPDPDPNPDPNVQVRNALVLPAGTVTSTPATIVTPETTNPGTAAPNIASSGTVPTAIPPTAGTPSTVTPNTVTPSTVTASTTVGAPVTETAAADNSPQSIGAQAEALLPFNWQEALPGWTITYEGPNSGFRGLTYPYDQTIEMFVRDGDTPESLVGILAHELGHAIDVTYFDDGDRNDWQEARSIENSQWWPDAYASDFQTGAGDFAEAFAYWAVQDPSSSQIAGTPTTEQLAVIDRLVEGAL